MLDLNAYENGGGLIHAQSVYQLTHVQLVLLD